MNRFDTRYIYHKYGKLSRRSSRRRSWRLPLCQQLQEQLRLQGNWGSTWVPSISSWSRTFPWLRDLFACDHRWTPTSILGVSTGKYWQGADFEGIQLNSVRNTPSSHRLDCLAAERWSTHWMQKSCCINPRDCTGRLVTVWAVWWCTPQNPCRHRRLSRQSWTGGWPLALQRLHSRH